MYRRLYLLLPDAAHARDLVDTLPDAGVTPRQIHAITREGEQIQTLPLATDAQRRDLGRLVETWLWNGNLALFGLALIGLVVALSTGHPIWAVVMAAVMIGTFVAGLLFTYVPNVHLKELQPALSHGEVLVMIDVPKDRIHEVEEAARRIHPEAVVGGVGWATDAFGL